MAVTHEIMAKKLREHSSLSRDDLAMLQTLPHSLRAFLPNEDIVRQGDEPTVSVVVLEGMVARYHTLPDGRRQYISFHIAGDMPDAQTLFIEQMDHAVCAIDNVSVALIPHEAITAMFRKRPEVGIAIWRETLIDAAIFREAVTNNSARDVQSRMAHFFCEQYYRARAVGIAQAGRCRLPLTQTQIGETLGMSLVAVNRTIMSLRRTRAMDLAGGNLVVRNWEKLKEIGGFDPTYLHLKRPVRDLNN